MKQLKDYEKDLNKCSKCGLCESVCPLFKIDPNDSVTSKGKFILLHGITKGELKFSPKINKYVDSCIKCGKCKDFCPSGIDVCEILNVAKYEYMKSKFVHKVVKFLESKFVFGVFLKCCRKVTENFRPRKEISKNGLNVLYFKGCVNEVCPSTDKYLSKILKNANINIQEAKFDCCGLPFLSDGNLERFVEVAEYNSELINAANFDYLVTDCASCDSTIKSYSQYVSHAQSELNMANWGEIIADLGLKFESERPIKVAFHKPCHLKDDSFVERILQNCKNVEYVKLDNYDSCCGMAGTFALKNPEYASVLMKKKSDSIKLAEVDFVITTCPACVIGLNIALKKACSFTKVVSLLEILSSFKQIT